MTKYSVPEADGIKFAEMWDVPGGLWDPPFGGKPKSVRKRGWWRAFRAGKHWAITSPKIADILAKESPSMFSNVQVSFYCLDQIYIFWAKG